MNICHNCTEPNIGYKLTRDGNTLRCYMADTGLLLSHSFDENGIMSAQLYKKLMTDKLEINGGMMMENLVAQTLVAAGHKLYFFSSYSKDNTLERTEIDFLVTKPSITSRHNVSPIEVKSGKNHTLDSLLKFKEKYGSMSYKAFVIHTSDFKVLKGVTFLPLYMSPLL